MDSLMVYQHSDHGLTSHQAPEIFQMVCQRLIYNELASQFNMKILEDRVLTLYGLIVSRDKDQDDYFGWHRDTYFPSATQILDYLDEENYETIRETLRYYQDSVSPEEFEAIEDSITIRYDHEIACFLEDWVEKILMRHDLPYRGCWHQNNIFQTNPIQTGQIVLMPDFMKEGVSYAIMACSLNRK